MVYMSRRRQETMGEEGLGCVEATLDLREVKSCLSWLSRFVASSASSLRLLPEKGDPGSRLRRGSYKCCALIDSFSRAACAADMAGWPPSGSRS